MPPASSSPAPRPSTSASSRAELLDDDQPQASSLYASLHSRRRATGHPARRHPADPAGSTPTRRTSASGCAPATASSSSSTSRTRTRASTAASASCSPPPSPRAARRTSSTASARPTASSTTTTSEGNTSRKFLMRRPVRGEDVRITSGFGVRRHPILQIPEDAHRRRLGLRDRHADHGGRQRRHRGSRAARASTATTCASATPTATRPPTATCRASPRAWARASRCGRARSSATSARPACRRVRTCTSRCWSTTASSTRCRSRCRASASSTGKQLADFQKERARIDDLMRRNPVSTEGRSRRRAAIGARIARVQRSPSHIGAWPTDSPPST